MPGGKAFLIFLTLPVGVPSILVAGTCSKYGSYSSRSAPCDIVASYKFSVSRPTSEPKLFFAYSLKILLKMKLVMVKDSLPDVSYG